MLKIQKLSVAALMVSAVISGQVFAEDSAFDEKAASYAVGTLMGGQMKDLVDSHKEVIKYDNARILDGLKDALEGKVDVRKDEKIQKTLESIETGLPLFIKVRETTSLDTPKCLAHAVIVSNEFSKLPLSSNKPTIVEPLPGL